MNRVLFKKTELMTILSSIGNEDVTYIEDSSGNFPYEPHDGKVDLHKVQGGLLIKSIFYNFNTIHSVTETISITKHENGYQITLESEDYLQYNKNNELGVVKKNRETILEALDVVNAFVILMNV